MSGLTVQARDVAQEFGLRFGRRPAVSRAPGRVNLIGEHTDYNDGFVMPAALDFSTLVAGAPRARPQDPRLFPVHGRRRANSTSTRLSPSGRHDWSDYVFGVAAMLEASGLPPCRRRPRRVERRSARGGPELVGRARSQRRARARSPRRTCRSSRWRPPRSCQRAENEFVGMRCGIMDQYIAACGVAGTRC